MNGITLHEARLLCRALDMLVKYGHDALTEEDLDHAYSLRAELMEFERIVRENGTLYIWTDGAARPTNPGPAGIGVVAKIGSHIVFEIAEHIGHTTNNVAEYMAAVTALRRAIDLGARRIMLHSDSKLVVNQFNGEWRCNDESLKPLLGRLRGLAERFDEFKIVWIPREQNREADGLSVAGAYSPRLCGACGHPWHVSFCLGLSDPNIYPPNELCACPHGFSGGLKA